MPTVPKTLSITTVLLKEFSKLSVRNLITHAVEKVFDLVFDVTSLSYDEVIRENAAKM